MTASHSPKSVTSATMESPVYKIPHKTELSARKPPKIDLARNLKSIRIMPSVLTCTVITLREHQPVSTVGGCMPKQR